MSNQQQQQQHHHPFPQGISSVQITAPNSPIIKQQQQLSPHVQTSPLSPNSFPQSPHISSLFQMPSEVLVSVLFFLDHKSIVSFGECCRYLNRLSNHQLVWKELCLNITRQYWRYKKGAQLIASLRALSAAPSATAATTTDDNDDDNDAHNNNHDDDNDDDDDIDADANAVHVSPTSSIVEREGIDDEDYDDTDVDYMDEDIRSDIDLDARQTRDTMMGSLGGDDDDDEDDGVQTTIADDDETEDQRSIVIDEDYEEDDVDDDDGNDTIVHPTDEITILTNNNHPNRLSNKTVPASSSSAASSRRSQTKNIHKKVIRDFLKQRTSYVTFEEYVLSILIDDEQRNELKNRLMDLKMAEQRDMDRNSKYLALPDSNYPITPTSPAAAFVPNQYIDWKNRLIELLILPFDSSLRINNSKCKYSNYDRTAFNSHSSNSNWWETIRSKKLMKSGSVFHWCIFIDKLVRCPENLWWILIGVEVPGFKWEGQDHWVDVIGFHEYKGSCLICGPMKKRYLGREIPVLVPHKEPIPEKDAIKTGDTIFVRFDTRYSSAEADVILERLKKESDRDLEVYQRLVARYEQVHNGGIPLGATIEFWKNESYEPCGKVTGITGQLFYPTVSIVHKQQVSIGVWNGPSD